MSEISFGIVGETRWTLNGKLHREDGPAIEFLSGTRKWYLNGRLHREGGPACEYTNKWRL